MICKRCNGTGHDKGGKPEYHFEPYVDKDGKKRRRYVTDRIGSGCLACSGKVTA